MRICLINGPLQHPLETLGHEVRYFSPPPGVSDVRALLTSSGFQPDLLLQTEVLGPRVILAGLDAINCKKVFWSVDTHLNSFWHVSYGKLFDAVATTQYGWVPKLSALGLSQVYALPWCGFPFPWKPYAKRCYDVAFCGRIGPERPIRQRFAHFLRESFKARVVQDLDMNEMIALYSDARIVPNEAIAGEINFRVFEAASCGSVVITPRGSDLERLFDPGREVDVYSGAMELADRLRYWLARPSEMELMGEAARARVLAEHLPIHRACALLDALEGLNRVAATGHQAELAFHLTLLELLEAGRLDVPPSLLITGFSRLKELPEAIVGLMRLFYFIDKREELTALLEEILAEARFEGALNVEATGSLAAMALGKWDMAKIFWYRHCNKNDLRFKLPENQQDLCFYWGTELARQGRIIRQGFVFNQMNNLPQSAFEFLASALAVAPGDTRLVRAAEAQLSGFPGTEDVRLGLLSELSLRDTDNWNLGLRLGMVNLQAFRVDEGIHEILIAREIARAQNTQTRFDAALLRVDPTGAVRTAIENLHLSDRRTPSADAQN